MPKFYVTCLGLENIVDTSDEIRACALTALQHGTITAGMSWVVSERGFGKHEDDVLIPDEYIIKEYQRILNKRMDQ